MCKRIVMKGLCPYYPAVPAVVGTTRKCDMTGFESSG